MSDEQRIREEEPRPHEEPPAPRERFGPAGEKIREVSPREYKHITRRELLKVAPLLALGAFAVPMLQEPLLMKKGLGFADWASATLFSRTRLAPTFSNSEVEPFPQFPY